MFKTYTFLARNRSTDRLFRIPDDTLLLLPRLSLFAMLNATPPLLPPLIWWLIEGRVGWISGSRLRKDEIHRLSVWLIGFDVDAVGWFVLDVVAVAVKALGAEWWAVTVWWWWWCWFWLSKAVGWRGVGGTSEDNGIGVRQRRRRVWVFSYEVMYEIYWAYIYLITF